MRYRFDAPWHKVSFDRFLSTRLPELLAERLPLAGYRIEPDGPHTCRLHVELPGNGHPVSASYGPIPTPDEQGLFWHEGHPRVHVPVFSGDALDQAEVRCVGEQLYDVVEARLTPAPPGVAWDEGLLRALLPLDEWINGFLRAELQWLDTTNWSARHTHLRRIKNVARRVVTGPGEQGRVDPYETPEGSYIGRIFTVAAGAEIRDGRLVIVDPSPPGGLGHNSLMVPFLEHNDPNRLLMGVNMMRQALVPPDPEPALVQTGYEPDPSDPDTADLWCGRNLLTAFIDAGEATALHGILLSESAVRRLNYPYPAEAGDKLANRHGTKGVVAKVLPDEQMPHLPDGTPVELVYSFDSLHSRMNFGQIREAVMGRLARAEGRPAVVPPFAAPSAEEIRRRLAQAGLPESGMERLRWGKDGAALPLPSTVGYVYWYRLAHLAADKLRASSNGEEGQMLGELEVIALRQAGAWQNALEAVSTRSIRHPGARTLAARRAEGPIEPVGPPTPLFAMLAGRLRAAGIAAELEGNRVAFRLAAPPEGEGTIRLAAPVPHPWLPERTLEAAGLAPEMGGWDPDYHPDFWDWAAPGEPVKPPRSYAALAEANQRLERLLSSQVPRRLVDEATRQLQAGLAAYFDDLLPPAALRFREPQAFSGRAVIAPGDGLALDQVGLPDTLAQTLFGPLARREGKPLDEVMAGAWVIVLRAPAVAPNALVALRPLRVAGPAIRINPRAAELLNADFDGDQAAVFLPLTEAAQREAGERLSPAAHLRRDPALVTSLLPPANALWGLAWLSLGEGRAQIEAVLGRAVHPPLTQSALARIAGELLERNGPAAALDALERLTALGYAASRASGASLSPFAGEDLSLPPQPDSDDPETWAAYAETVAESIFSLDDYTKPSLGPQLLSAAIRARGRSALPILAGLRGVVYDAAGQPTIVRRSLVRGLAPEEVYACVPGARQGLARLAREADLILTGSGGPAAGSEPDRAHILARARRSRRPGIVFARAAANGESDPLEDEESRLMVGL